MNVPIKRRKGISKIVSAIVLGLIIFSLSIGIFYFPGPLRRKVEAGIGETSSETETGPETLLPSKVELVSDFSDYDIPENLDDLKADLNSVGCDTIITVHSWDHDLRLSSYQDVLKLASIAKFVAIYESSVSYGILIPIEGIIYEWATVIATETKFEKVEIQSGVCTKQGATGSEYWNITLKLKNSGSATSTLIGCYINDVELDGYNANHAVDGQALTSMERTETIASGASKYIRFLIDCNYRNFKSGTTINIKLHSSGGMDYIKLIELV